MFAALTYSLMFNANFIVSQYVILPLNAVIEVYLISKIEDAFTTVHFQIMVYAIIFGWISS